MTSISAPSFRLAVESVIRYRGKVLLTKRAEGIDVAPGVWNVPAGKVKLLEITADAAKRETLEEVGFAVNIVHFLEERTALIQSKGEPSYRNIFTYLTEAVEKEPKVVLNGEHSEYKWVSSEELDNTEFNSLLPKLKEIIRCVLKNEG
ncbi:MAG TPA: NUDIX hydrolase [Chlamydiales bacterium]|nr:MAG: hypothetical protein A3F67_11975 [Verrucomicrobia bacterium RIFCSPHIGHO2_12_FULL_41_10]HLB52604.1 NUDIX hydrolase [Chlamydiales bacterium]